MSPSCQAVQLDGGFYGAFGEEVRLQSLCMASKTFPQEPDLFLKGLSFFVQTEVEIL